MILDYIEEETYPDDTDPIAVVESINYAFDCIETLSASVACLEAAVQNPSASSQLTTLRFAEATRQQISNIHGIEGFLSSSIATESIRESRGMVFALEEEAAKEKGIIGRMIDAVIKAFEWLWKKISSIFTSGDNKDSAEKRKVSTESDFEAAIKATASLPANAVLDGNAYKRRLAYFGNDTDVATLEQLAVDHEKWSKELFAAIEAVSKRMNDLRGITGKFSASSSPEELGKNITEFSTQFLNDIKSNIKDPYKAEVHSKFGTVAGNKKALDQTQSVVLGPVLGNHGAGILVGGPAGDDIVLTKYLTFKGSEAGGKLKLPAQLEALRPLLDKSNVFSKAFIEQKEEGRRQIDKIKNDAEAIKSALKSLKSGESKIATKEGQAMVTKFISVANGFGSAQATLASTVMAFEQASLFFDKVINDAIGLAKGNKPPTDEKPVVDNKPTEEAPAEPAKAKAAPAKKK